jgi:hypothetical protein
MRTWLLLAVLCVAAGGPPMPPTNTIPKTPKTVPELWKKGVVKPKSASPKVSAIPQSAALIVVPVETNYCRWWTSEPVVPVNGGASISLDGPEWVWVQRCNDLSRKPQVFTNVWNGVMPTNHTIDFISTAPRGVKPFYRFILSFEK